MSVKWGVLGTANIAKGCTIPGMKEALNCELNAELLDRVLKQIGY